jgi:HlyD family secretion protein
MFSRRNLVITGIVLLGLAAAGAFWWQSQQAAAQSATEIRQATIEQGTILSTVSATGALSPESQVSLFFGTSAPSPVAKLNVAVGDVVKAGTVLAELNTTDLQLAVTQAEQNLRAAELRVAGLTAPPRPEDLALAEANLKVANAQAYQGAQGSTAEQIEIARLNLVLAQRSLDQLYQQMDDFIERGNYAGKQALEGQEKQLQENAQIANLRYQQAVNRRGSGGTALGAQEQAEVALEKLKRGPDADDLKIAQLQVEQAQAALEVARNNLKDAQIIAPFAGVVAAVNLRLGEVASAALPAIVLVNKSSFYIEVGVDEVDIARIAAGQAVTITIDALPNDVFSGVVERISPQSTVNAGVVNYPVRVLVNSTDERLRGGMTSTTEIVVREAKDVVLVPNWAIRREAGQTFASVLRNGQLEEVEVKLGQRNENVSEVLSGLSVGDVVGVSTAREQFSFFGGGN